MFSCYQRHGKCEWREGGLDKFVAHYNRENSTNYTLAECLDILRTGGRTEPKPEVLVADASSSKQMVIERKSVVWPPNYIRRHQNEHDFSDTIWQQTKDRFRDDCYELTVSAAELGKLDSRTVKQFALQIGSTLTANTSILPIRGATPIRWHFRRGNTHDDSTMRKGIVVIQQGSTMSSFQDFNIDDAVVGTTASMERELVAAAAKFAAYELARRIVLLDFYGDDLSDEDLPPLLERIALPQAIDEIWMSKQVWVSEDDFEIGFERLLSK